MMRKLTALTLCCLMAVGLFAGCRKNKATETTVPTTTAATTHTTEATQHTTRATEATILPSTGTEVTEATGSDAARAMPRY